MTSDRNQLIALIQQGAIPAQHAEAAAEAVGLYPSGKAWIRFLSQLLLWLGSLALACSVLFFIAYNWSEMGRLFRFALVEAALLLAIAAYWKLDGRGLAAQAALVAAALLLGVLLALFGQVYQTGADPWQLFFNWALLMLPWVLVARLAALWILWLGLINLSLLLYHQVFGGVFSSLFGNDASVHWLLFALNGLALIIWELASRRWSWLATSWAKRLLALANGFPITLLALQAISDHGQLWLSVLLAYPLWLSVLYYFYRIKQPDLFMLAGGCLSLITVLVYFLGHNILRHTDAGSFLILAFAILGLSTAAAVWLKRLHREFSL